MPSDSILLQVCLFRGRQLPRACARGYSMCSHGYDYTWVASCFNWAVALPYPCLGWWV